jgi:hypothetical protein
MRKLYHQIVIASIIAMSFGGVRSSDGHSSRKFSIEDLLSTTYPYTDPRTDYQLDMDPCKSGETFAFVHTF